MRTTSTSRSSNGRRVLEAGVLAAVMFGLVFSVSACKRKTAADLADAATTSSFKTGFFMPRTKSQFQIVGKKSPISVVQFLERAREISGTRDLRLLIDEKITYAVTVNGSGEQLLVMVSKNDVPLPVLSISGSVLNSWHQRFELDQKTREMEVSELFVKAPWGKSPTDYKVEQMYVRRYAQNDLGTREPVLVPWLSHVRSETDKVVTFQMGNSVLEARLGYPLLEFRQLGTKPVWYIVGRYKDRDVEAGTVFWRTNDQTYYSQTRGSDSVTEWRVQDGDSIDRVGSVARGSVQIPTLAKEFLDRLADAPKADHPREQTIIGFDSWAGDATVFQLDRNSMTLIASTSSGFGLTSGDNEVLTPDDYKPRGLALGFFWSSNKPVTFHEKSDGSGMQGSAWTDQDGNKHGGTLLSSRNVHIPGGMFTGDKYEMRHFIHNATNNTVSEVAADGRVLRSGMPVSEFQSRQQTNINVDRMQREGGSDASAMRQANKLAERSAKQLEISESFMGGRTTGEMAGNVTRDLAIGQVRTQIDHGLGPVGSSVSTVVGDQVEGVIKGETKGFSDVGSTFVQSGVQAGLDVGEDRITKTVANSVWKNTDLSATNSMKAGGAAFNGLQAGNDMFFKYQELKNNGSFDPTSPDAAFNAAVGRARVAGAGVENVAGVVFTGGMAPGTRQQEAAQELVSGMTGTLFDGTASLSHAIHAGTIERERTQVLENVGQRMRDASAAKESMSALEKLNSVQGGVLPPQTPTTPAGPPTP